MTGSNVHAMEDITGYSRDGTKVPTEMENTLREKGAHWGQHVLEGAVSWYLLASYLVSNPVMRNMYGSMTGLGGGACLDSWSRSYSLYDRQRDDRYATEMKKTLEGKGVHWRQHVLEGAVSWCVQASYLVSNPAMKDMYRSTTGFGCGACLVIWSCRPRWRRRCEKRVPTGDSTS